jgi:uncharacterized protein (UPF0264 family)
VALGELTEWLGSSPPDIPGRAWSGIAYRKLGLAGTARSWRASWRELRLRLGDPSGPAWIAVAYADWRRAGAPDPEAVLDAASEFDNIVGVLLDTWDKTERLAISQRLIDWAARVRHCGKLLAAAGGLDADRLGDLDSLIPDIVAVRGAACVGGDRRAPIDPLLVGRLAGLASRIPSASPVHHGGSSEPATASNRTPCASGSALP